VPTLTAAWNGARGAWVTPGLAGLCGHSELYSATLPTSGSMRNGRLYAHPTPAHSTAVSASSSSHGLLPTPKPSYPDETPENFARRRTRPRRDGTPAYSGTPLNVAVETIRPAPGGSPWGQYARSVARWAEITGLPAPAPVCAGPDGRPQLAAGAVEFLMGLPSGWVTAVPGLTRRQQLALLGNGVVPQQGQLALSWLIRRSGH
jgi:DNA (cytosine-5)-methyltransferase 1